MIDFYQIKDFFSRFEQHLHEMERRMNDMQMEIGKLHGMIKLMQEKEKLQEGCIHCGLKKEMWGQMLCRMGKMHEELAKLSRTAIITSL